MPRLGCIRLPRRLGPDPSPAAEGTTQSRDASDRRSRDAKRSLNIAWLGSCLGRRVAEAMPAWQPAATQAQHPASSGSGSGSDAGGAGSDAMLPSSDGSASTAASIACSDEILQRSVAGCECEESPDNGDEPSLLLWRRFSLSQYLASVSPHWRRLVGCFQYSLVARPSNDKSLGLQGWRSGALRRWELTFPVLTVIDEPGQARPGEGFHEWPLFDIFKIDLRGLSCWADYLASLKRADRWNVRNRDKLFRSFESDGRLVCQLVALGPEAFGGGNGKGGGQTKADAGAAKESMQRHALQPNGSDAALRTTEASGTRPPVGDVVSEQARARQEVQDEARTSTSGADQQQQQRPRPLKHGKRRGGPNSANGAAASDASSPSLPSRVTPGSAAEAEALLGQLWRLYEQTGSRNGFVECTRGHFESLVREAPGVQAVVIREGTRGGGNSSSGGGNPSAAAAASGPILAFGLLLPQRESLQVLYVGMQYDNPLVRQSSCYFQILSVGLQVALAHNESVRMRAVALAAAAKDLAAQDNVSCGTSPAAAAAAGAALGSVAVITAAAASASCAGPSAGTTDGKAAGAGSQSASAMAPPLPPPPLPLPLSPSPPPPTLPVSPLGSCAGLIDWLDLGPGRRFVKEHLGAVGHPVSMYTRGIGPIAHAMSRRLLSRYFSPSEFLNDP